MIPLILSIASSTVIFVIFKLFKKYSIDTFQAIVINYFTAAILGFSLYGHQWDNAALEDVRWMKFAVLAALLFIGLFFIMGKSSQLNGVASTSVAVKMSMAVSLLFMVYMYSEEVGFLKITGIMLAFIGVFLVSTSSKASNGKKGAAWMLLLLFLGSGILDSTLNYVLKHELGVLTSSLFSAIGLGLAGVLGFLILMIRVIQGNEQIKIRNVFAGVILGIPNYFSIYLLLLSYKSTGWQDSTVLAITNVSVVLGSAIIGFIAFKEDSNTKKIIGLISAILAIATLYIASTI